MKTYKLLLSLLVGALAALSVLAVLSLGTATAGTLHEWIGHRYWKDGGWTDYAPSGVPDFDQKQDCWGIGGCPAPGIPPARWTYCGPVAAANSLWWFDSKFEPSPAPPLTINDNYYLVTSYGFFGPPPGWDDHNPSNVNGMAPAPGGLVDDLAWYFDTDGQRTHFPQQGTNVRNISYGLQWYLYGGNPAWGVSPYGPRYGNYYDDYHVQLVKMPTFDWVEAEVERSEDVILLLGCWQWQDPDGLPGSGDERWVRLGGHYVTVAGINSTDHQIAFSDPFFDNAEA